MKSETVSFLHDRSYGCGSPIVSLVGRIWISLVHASLDTYIARSLLFGPSRTARNRGDIMQQSNGTFRHSL